MSHPQQPAPGRKAVWPFVLMAVFALPAAIVVRLLVQFTGIGYDIRGPLSDVIWLALPLLIFLAMLIGGIVGAIVRANANAKLRGANAVAAPAAPVGYTTDGQPVYPVVGYTADGKPVTANQLMGRPTQNPSTERYS